MEQHCTGQEIAVIAVIAVIARDRKTEELYRKGGEGRQDLIQLLLQMTAMAAITSDFCRA